MGHHQFELYAYVADDATSSSLWQCMVQTTGDLNACSQMTITGYGTDIFVGTAIGYTAP